MRSITLKLVIGFVSISVLSTLLVVAFTRWRSREEFRTFLIEQNRPGVVGALSNYYQEHGSWSGIAGAGVTTLSAATTPQIQRGPFTLIDSASNTVVLAGEGYELGGTVAQPEISAGIPIQSDHKTVGILLINRPQYRIGAPGSAFLDRVNLQILLGSLLAIGLALLLAIVISRTLTRPIRELTLATQSMASGGSAQHIPVRSRDELGLLAGSFNRMSLDLSRSLELRRQMTADIAHELRTPISIILGHAEAVHDGVLLPSAETFQIVREEAERLEHLVDDLRTLSMADAGELKLLIQICQVGALLRGAEKVYAHRAKQEGITLVTQIEPDVPDVEVDAQRIQEALTNILDNAIRYTPDGGTVTLSARPVADEVEIRVADTGPGVAAEDLDRIFERFYRTEAARSREEGGSGLGFAIARSIIAKHNGRIWATSEPGQGLHVVIRLPAANHPPEAMK